MVTCKKEEVAADQWLEITNENVEWDILPLRLAGLHVLDSVRQDAAQSSLIKQIVLIATLAVVLSNFALGEICLSSICLRGQPQEVTTVHLPSNSLQFVGRTSPLASGRYRSMKGRKLFSSDDAQAFLQKV
ncbi:unnamed protein product [Soboliphyme baturini]|uniref:Uncharacterized protein n=1 Tax=Soboliphyme baturini TaxID=241478 RepID=A0A183ISY9_9BILA|nr:unnamed protein product [Soboliphyme baturini]